MKNEDRILELLAETRQRMDQYRARFDKWQEEIRRLREEMKVQQETMQPQLDVNSALMIKMQQHDSRLTKHEDGIDKLIERADLLRESALEQQKAYREMTELLLFHNTALRAKNIL